jgi:signal transduction histidine kinase/CheY-like chemotaxis protein
MELAMKSYLRQVERTLLRFDPDDRLDVIRRNFDAGTRHILPMLLAALVALLATNWIIWMRVPNLVLPLGSLMSLGLLAMTLRLRSGTSQLDRAGLASRVRLIHALTACAALSLVGSSIVVADYLPEEDTVAGIALIIINATIAILVGFAFSALTGVGLLQLLVAGIPGTTKVLYDGVPDAIAITVMFIAIVAMMVRIIGASNAARRALVEAKSDLEEAMVRAESADRAKSEFLASMSHELRTPLNGVLGMAELLASSNLDGRQKTFADIIMRSGNMLLAIINDVLDYSRIDAGQIELHLEPFDVTETVEDVAGLLSARALEKNLEILVRLDQDIPPAVIGDPGRFRQILTNLAGNAIKFTEQGHVLIDVSCRRLDGQVELLVKVEDTGIGIPEDKLGDIFQRFSQVDQSSTRRHDGAGLGLAIASGLVEAMGGEIAVNSSLGQGSTFWFNVRFDISQDRQAPPPPIGNIAGSRVLIIDDNAINRRILEEQLRGWELQCVAVENGETGLAFLDHAHQSGAFVDCVVLDYQMPGMNGVEVAEIMASRPWGHSVPVVLLTSVDQTGQFSSLAGGVIKATLSKPARTQQLCETIFRVVVSNRHARAERGDKEVHTARPAAAHSEQSDSQAGSGSAQVTSLWQIDVVVAEDNEINQLVMREFLDDLGLSYRIVDNGRSAVELFRSMPPKLILMDVAMPELNGFEATSCIRQMEIASSRHTPIIGVTAHALKGDREKCLEAGMDDYLAKPISAHSLEEKIRHWMPEVQFESGTLARKGYHSRDSQ